jgi:hypothetical protein
MNKTYQSRQNFHLFQQARLPTVASRGKTSGDGVTGATREQRI